MKFTAARWFSFRLTSLLATCWMAAPLGVAPAASAAEPFAEKIQPFVAKFCVECHGPSKAEAELNLAKYKSAEAAADDFRQWEHVVTFVERGEMPPESSQTKPTDAERAEFLGIVRQILDAEGRKLAGDPGVVLPRRLSNAEYDHSIRDLTGVDIRPTRSFPVDPAAGEGFDNTGEALSMSPSLVAKLYAAAQFVADHAVLTTQGLEFAPHPVATFADRTKFYEQSILQFYEQHRVDYEKYLAACWEYRHRGAARQSTALDELARGRKLSAKYLKSLYELLQGDPAADVFYLGWLRRRWNEIPGPQDAAATQPSGPARDAIQRLARDVALLALQLAPRETEAIVSNAGNAPVDHLERRRRTAAERDTFDAKNVQAARRLHRDVRDLDRKASVTLVLNVAPVAGAAAGDVGYVRLKSLNFSKSQPNDYKPGDAQKNLPLKELLAEYAPQLLERLKMGVHPAGDAVDADTCVLAAGAPLEITLPTDAFDGARDLRFFVDVELDAKHAKSGAALISLVEKPAAAAGEKGAPPNAAKTSADSSAEPPQLLVLPAHAIAQDVARSGAAFCQVFPNRFYYVDDTRGLSAGFHLIEGFFRDDQPLVKHVLDDVERQQLDRLWTELEFVTQIAEKMLRGFVFFERSERNFLKHADFDPFKEEDPRLADHDTLVRFERVYLDRSNVKKPIEEVTTHPIHVFFEQIRTGLQTRREQLKRAEPIYLRNLESFAHAAYRRPLTADELNDLRKFYAEVAADPELGLEQAVRASLVRVLMSPYFGARITPTPDGPTVKPLDDLSLASRLSYFLWSSTPDAELLSLAEAGKLHDTATLLAQTRRMLKDERAADFAREFFGQWLGYRDFPQQESVDRMVFRDFDEPLKEAMFEEPTRLAAHLIRTNDSVLRLLDSDVTFVDERLAKHYGVPFSGAKGEWTTVSGLQAQGRAGVLGMGVFLTKHSQPQRTSPVKRGFWVVHKVLGEHIPAPPADVVALPAKETDTNGKTIRQLLALHVEDAKCARCHVRFDSVGLAMEGFDPIGRRRAKDLAGRPVDDVVRLADGSDARGVPEFARHLVKERRDDYVRTLCRKLLGYALGRSLQLSDQVLLDEMRIALDKHEDRFVPLFETIVLSRQFREQRCRDFSNASFRSQNAKP